MSGASDDDVDPDDVTLWAGRLRRWPVSPAVDGVDDDTVRSPRTTPDAGDTEPSLPVEPDDDTLRSRPGAAGRDVGAPVVGEPDERTSPRSRSAGPTASDVGAPGSVESGDETLRSVAGATEAVAPSRSSGAPSPLIDGDPPAGRDAHAPVALRRESYAPRLDAPVRVSRALSGRMPHTGDAANTRPRRAPGRARVIVIAAASVAVVALAVVGVILLLG